jgi:c-di-GMP-binding flagellar brake protein YcgR
MNRPRVGERVMLEVLPAGESYSGEVRALDTATMMVVPAARGPALPAPGTDVRITFVRKDGLYEEHGTIAEITGAPEPLISVELEGEVIRTQRRDYVRKDTSLNVDVIAGGRTIRSVTKDVSGGGVSVMYSEPPPFDEGQEFDIALNVPDGRQPIKAHCRAKYVREILVGSRWLVGSQFAAIAEEDRQRIVRFVFRLELAQGRSHGKK